LVWGDVCLPVTGRSEAGITGTKGVFGGAGSPKCVGEAFMKLGFTRNGHDGLSQKYAHALLCGMSLRNMLSFEKKSCVVNG
jgi:hypothetical protein